MSVECFDSEGAAVYDLIIKQVIQDLQITRSINDMKTFIDPTGPVCIIAIKPNKAQKQILFNDIGNYMQKEGEDKVQLFILDENYLPNVLNRLWDLEGREKIQQPGRYEIVINNDVTQNYSDKIINLVEEINNITLKWESEITTCSHMFYGLSNIINIDLSNFDISKVTNMKNMFNGC